MVGTVGPMATDTSAQTYDEIARRAIADWHDPEWEAHGELERAAELYAAWARGRGLDGAEVEVVRIDGLSPTVFIDVPATDPGATGTVLVYGHYDKQPPFVGWGEGRGPWTPTLEGDFLYGRGMADDGYAMPSALVALESIRAAGGRHARCVVLIEGSEESGSPHLPAVLAHLGAALAFGGIASLGALLQPQAMTTALLYGLLCAVLITLGAGHLRRGGPTPVDVAHRKHDLGAGAGEYTRRGPADAAVGAGHDHVAAGHVGDLEVA